MTAAGVEGGYIAAAISDKGSGVSEKPRRTLFDRFATTRKDGMGLGLSIRRAMIEAHGGLIRAETNAGGGGVFTRTVPSLAASADHG
jgi:signal transduction histidine kinase